MKQEIKLKDFVFGKTDAKNELLENSEEVSESFLHNFLMPENVEIDEFINYKRFFILGFKGIGKTALLHYLDLRIRQSNPNAASQFILFKSDLDDIGIVNAGVASNGIVVNKNNDSRGEEIKYQWVWRWFLHRQLVILAEKELKKNSPIFTENKQWSDYCACVMALNRENSIWDYLIPKVKKGKVQIQGDIKFLKATFGLEIERDSNDKEKVDFNGIVQLADKLLKELTPTGRDVYIFIDELEVSYSTKKQYERDILLIRDLIISIYKFYQDLRQLKYPIRIIAAVRSEIQNAIDAVGKEINKPLFDFGVILKWQQSGGQVDSHPLIKMINKRINTSERNLNLPESNSNEIWKKYFPPFINNQDTKEYILRRTWYRPRDIVRLLNLGRSQYPNEQKFTHQVFDGINKEYSSQSWSEMTEELAASYSKEEIDGIKQLLRGLPYAFTFEEIKERSNQHRNIYHNLDSLLKKHDLVNILEKLYTLGIIGNTGDNVRYSFRGDDGLILTNKMKIHDPLWNYLAVERRKDRQ